MIATPDSGNPARPKHGAVRGSVRTNPDAHSRGPAGPKRGSIGNPATPTFRKPISDGKVYAGGSPNFNESTGQYRTPVVSPINRADNPARVAQPKSSVNAIGGY